MNLLDWNIGKSGDYTLCRQLDGSYLKIIFIGDEEGREFYIEMRMSKTKIVKEPLI